MPTAPYNINQAGHLFPGYMHGNMPLGPPSWGQLFPNISEIDRPVPCDGALAKGAPIFEAPDWVVNILSTGWKQHISLATLTDSFCEASADADSSKMPPNLPDERLLTYEEWSQAWKRFIPLIRTHLRLNGVHRGITESERWSKHRANIERRPSLHVEWPLYLAYDISTRRYSLKNAIDGSQFHQHIWDAAKARFDSEKLKAIQSDFSRKISVLQATLEA